MRIIKFEQCQNKDGIIKQIRAFDWDAAKFLADILEQNRFDQLLGGGDLFIMLDGDGVVSFATLARNDCVKDDTRFPWIGFVFTAPEYRGHRYSEKIIDAAYNEAIERGHSRVYLATDHIGFYEKYGFTYLETRIDIYNEESRVYYK